MSGEEEVMRLTVEHFLAHSHGREDPLEASDLSGISCLLVSPTPTLH